MARGVAVQANAKINLFLRILAREASGFHQIETLFLKIALADVIRVRPSDGGVTLDVSGAFADRVGDVEQNLAWRAARAYFTATGREQSVSIEIEKHIPVGAGLGGGSADAAAVLRALDHMSPSPIGQHALLEIAASLGADIPFLVSDAACALGWGRGGRMLNVPAPRTRDVELYVPGVGVNTAAAYGWLAASRAGADNERPSSVDVDSLSDWDKIALMATNDFEQPVGQNVPAVSALLTSLREMSPNAMTLMSGSGSTVFQMGGVQLFPARSDVLHMGSRTLEHVEPVVPIE